MKSVSFSKIMRLVFLIFASIIVNAACKIDVPVQYLGKSYVEPVKFNSKVKQNGSVIVSMSTATEEAVIYFTTDGKIPDENCFKYSGPVTFSETISIILDFSVTT